MGSSTCRVNVTSTDGRVNKVVAFATSEDFATIKQLMAAKVYGAAARNVSADLIAIAARTRDHGEFDIDDVDGLPLGTETPVVVRLLNSAGSEEGEKKVAAPPVVHALPKPSGGFMHANDNFNEAKVPEVKRIRSTSDADKLFPFVVLGSSNVGKTCLIQRYHKDIFSTTCAATISVATEFTCVQIGEVTVSIRITDTSGQPRWWLLAESHIRTAKGILIVFDVTDVQSFDYVRALANSVMLRNPKLVEQGLVLLVGNKVDCVDTRQVTQEEASAFAEASGLPYFETSALDGVGIDPPFNFLSTKLLNLYPDRLAMDGARRGGASHGAGRGRAATHLRLSTSRVEFYDAGAADLGSNRHTVAPAATGLP